VSERWRYAGGGTWLFVAFGTETTDTNLDHYSPHRVAAIVREYDSVTKRSRWAVRLGGRAGVRVGWADDEDEGKRAAEDAVRLADAEARLSEEDL
jgi:hypothetical protein